MTLDTPPDYVSVTADEFPAVAALFAGMARRRITEVHLHHTFTPTHEIFNTVAEERGGDAMAAGLELCRGMWRFHVEDRDFADIAQHVSIDPVGRIWLNRNWDRPPASCSGFNGDQARGPFMIETIGNFDQGCDVLDGDQRHAVLCVIAGVQRACGLAPDALVFHNDMTDLKSCPGTGVDKAEVLGEVALMFDRIGAAGEADVPVDRKTAMETMFRAFMATDFGALKDGPLGGPA